MFHYPASSGIGEVPIPATFSPKGSNLRKYCGPARRYAALLPNSSGCVELAATVETPSGITVLARSARKGDLAGETALIIRRLILLLGVAAFAAAAGQALAQGAFPAPPQGAFPAPLPGRAPMANDPAFPPVNGAAPSAAVGAPPTSFPVTGAAPLAGGGFERPAPPPQQSGPGEKCMKAFLPLREEAERRGKLIKTASERHASPEEACKLIGNFSQAEMSMMKYVDTHSAECGIPPQVSQQLKAGHKNTEVMQQKVCAVAQQQMKGPAGPSLSDVLGSAAALPQATSNKKEGASTFDTLNGNVLTR